MVDKADAPDSIFKFGDNSLHPHAIYPVLGTELGLCVCQTRMLPAELHPQPCHLYKIAKMARELLLKEQLYPQVCFLRPLGALHASGAQSCMRAKYP